MEGDEDEEDVDDIEHEFKISDEKNKHNQMAEAMLHGKMSYGRGPEDDDNNAQFPPVIAGNRSRPVSGEFPISSHAYGDQMLSSSLHKRVHPYPVSEPDGKVHYILLENYPTCACVFYYSIYYLRS